MTNQSRKNDHSKSNEKKSKLTLTNEPDVFINLAHKIYDESITNHERIAEAITSEIQKIRLHAISTIYICSSRNKTVLNDERLKQIQHHQTDDDDIDFKKIIVKILGTLADRDNIDYKKFFTTCLEHIEKNIIVEDSISYIYQQSTDETRCQELFNENIICRIIGLLENIYLSEQTKLHICMIINNYLEHSSSKALNESQLQIFAHVLNNLPYNFELKLEALRSIILTAVKNRHLPDFIIQTLIKNIDKDDNKLNSLAIIALDIVSQRQIIPNVDKLSTKLLVDWIIVNEGAGITCEKMSSDNVDCQSISSLAAEIFVNTLKNNLMINNRTLEHLTKALNSNDKQTCILSAKALYLASETHELGNDVLIELKEHIENKINDVIVYSTVAYTRGLVKLSSNEGSIMKSHMECLPKIYVFDDLQLDEETFADTVNNNILSVLLNVSKHNLFDDHMFVIFNHILSFESCNQVVAIKILYNYSANKYSIPQDTILALENAIDIPEISHEATKVLSNVIKNRQLINEKFLRHLTDNLYLSNDDQLRKESFELLDIANDNQDISDEFFYILELERAISIINSFSLDRNDAMSYLYEMTEQNQKITLNGFKILDKIMSSQFVFDEKIFGILLNTCKNEQSIPDNLINKLVERFNPRQINCQLIDIFQNLVKNNQNIPTKLLSKLEKALENTLISDQVLSIFVLLALKGQYLSENILTKILDKILVLENSLIIEQYLSVIFSLIQNKDYFKKNFLSSLFTFFTRFSTNDISLVSRIQSVLIHILKGNNQNVIRASLNGLKILVTFHKVKLNQKSTDILLDLAGNTICDETMKNDINVLLNISKLDNSQQCKMKLLRLKYKSNDELLEALAKFSKPKLFQQNFDQLNNIINNSSELNEKVLKILLECSNKDKITDTLLYSIIFLMNSTNSKEMRSLCRDLIIETIRAGKIVSNKIISCIVTQNDVLKLIAKKQPIPEKFQHHLNLFSRIVSIDNIDLKDFSEFLENIRHEFNQDYKLSDLSMSKLLSIQITNNDYDICMKLEQELFHIFVLILKHNPTYSSQLSIVNRLEKAILFENINKNILMTYQEVIKMKQYQTNNLSKILDSLVDLLDSNKFLNVEVELLTCIALISEVMGISKNETLEKYLSNDNDRIRSWSFRGLRVAYDRNDKSKIFEEWCNNIMINLEFHTRVKVVMDLDLFETISTIKYIDFNKIYNKPQNQWNRELLIFDLLERFTLNQIEQFDFYKTWLEIEEYTGFQQDQSDILLKLLHRIQLNNMISFNQCNELIRILKNIDFESIYNILSNSSNPYEDILKKFFKDLIFERLSNKEINKKYIDNLVRKMIIKFSFDISKKLLNTIHIIDDLREFEEFLDFVEENKIKIFDINVQYKNISTLKRSFELQSLNNQIVNVDHRKLTLILSNLLDSQWSFEQLNMIFKNLIALNNEEKRIKEINFLYVLEILSQYSVIPTVENLEKISEALKESAQNWQRLINIIAVEAKFRDIGQLRNVTELIEEFEKTNSQNKNLIKLVDLINNIKSTNLISKIVNQTMGYRIDEKLKKRRQVYISEWTKDEIQEWAKTIKNNVSSCKITDDFIVETLAIIKRAYLLDSGFHLTDAQILSCIILLKANTDKGMLLQVGTGEGKSTIIAVLAVIHALKGNKVDVITSSPVLAERDAKEKENFYNMFNLQCSDNSDKTIYWTGPKSCYKSEIVYGEVAQFQFDTLRTEYSQLNTLGNRKFEVAIVDEVDSMLIDDSSKIARLATIIPGIDQLQLIYYTIWYRLIYLQDRMLEINNKIYLFHGKISFEQEKIILEYIDEQQGNIIKIPDLKIYIESISNISHIGILISENIEVETFIKKDIENYIRDLLNRLTIIPKSFEEFVDTQMCKWIDNAMIALNYQENVHYVVHQGLIKPVDYASTGIVQSFSHWGDGLHQFLQLKHNLRMTSETFTTNFLSNKGFFIKYGSNLFGLTGTLGSEKAKQVLADIYNVNLGIIPSMRQKQYLSLPDLVLTNEVDWLNEICRSAINESRKERGILVICETIEYSTQIVEKLQREYSSGTIKLYTMNNMNQEKHIEKIYPREIIVATNLAARGNDIKTDNIKKYGGLHVIITFMPPNKRVEEQAFGRTARQGKRGTGQRIINASSLAHYENFNIQKITELRDSIETNILDDFQKRELKIITLKDELFTKFCLLLNEIRQKIRDKSSLYVKVKSQAKKILTKISPSILESNILLSIEEQWAMFLREIDNQISPIDNEIFYERFEKFSKNIRKNYENDCIIKNPYCHIAIANDLVINESSLRRNYDDAMKHFDLAIELDPKHTAAAFAGKGWLTLKGKENFFGSNKQSIGYKEAAIRLFNKALEILSEEISTLTVIQSFLKHRCQNMNTDLSKQLMQKNNILSSYCNSLENAVNIIKKSQRLIQITELIDYSKLRENEINSKFFTKKDSVNFQSEISQKIISYDAIEKGCGKWCDVRLISHNNLNHYKTSIQNGKEIIVMKGIHNTFTVVYKDKIQCRLREWIVEDSTLANVLAALSYDETILDRDIHMKIYTLIYEKLTSKNGHIREEFLVFLQESTDHNQYEVTFNDLTVRQDSKIKDQAIEIIDKILPQDEGSLFDINGEFSFFNKVPNFLKKSGILEHDYEHINITMQQVKAEKLREYLNPNIEVKDLTKEEALTQLKEKNFFFNRYLLPQACFVDLYRINLEIISENNNKLENMADLKATVAIKRIEERIDQNERFNLSFISANKTAKILEKVLYRSNITVEFIDLGVESVREKLRTIVSRSLTLELTNTKETLLEVIRSLTTEQIQLYNRVKEQSIIEVVNRITAEKKILEISNTFATIKLIDINKSIVENVLNICSNANFNITFINIKNSCLLIGLKDELINVKIDMLRKNAAKTIIEQIRKHKLEFSLVFSQLTCNQVKQIIELAPIEQENIEVQQFRTLSELFMSQLRPNVELAEFSGRGIEYLIEINEKKFISWTSIAIICALASVQMAVGGLLIASGFGATLGMSLVTEGGADLFIAYRVYSTRQFSWSDFAKQKAVSLIISIASIGLSPLKDAAKGAQNLVVGVGEEVLEQAGTRVITNGRSVYQTLNVARKNLNSLAVKHIAVTIQKNIIRECLSKSMDVSSHFLLNQWKPKVSESIQREVYTKFCGSILKTIVNKMYTLDLFTKKTYFKEKLHKILFEIINPEDNVWSNEFDVLADVLCKRILSSMSITRSFVNIGNIILCNLRQFREIIFIVDRVYNQLLKKLSNIDQETLTMRHILQRYCEVDGNDITNIINILQEQNIINQNEEFNEQNFSEEIIRTHLNQFNVSKEKIVNVFKFLYSNISNIDNLNEIMKLVSDIITEQIFRITESQLILPLNSCATGNLTNIFSETVERYLVVDEKQNSPSQNREENSRTYNTIREQIGQNAKDYTIAYSQCEMIHCTKQRDEINSQKFDEKISDYITGVKMNLPANISDILTLAEKHGLELKLVDDPSYEPTHEDKTKCTSIVLYNKRDRYNQEDVKVGYFELLSNDTSEYNISNTNSDSAYTVIQQILKRKGICKTIEALRHDRAKIIEDNPHQFSIALRAQEWIENHYPQEMNNLLIIGSDKSSRLSNNENLIVVCSLRSNSLDLS
ncbi:unnamed protein product [Rotaria sp. Silwood1]|nr:unnamed protein product [Rotaria sp. Silwood1]CAF1496110.1 unnamed protein product [Rotaria sp. Silwood1]